MPEEHEGAADGDDGQALRDTRLVCASLMVSLIPLHEGIAKQRKFYSLAKQLFDEYLNSSDKGAVQNSE